uniref:Uncharacterized protein n=1 Tax=Arundo donax TaxID=35708 RepID=A0A0A8ZFX3_ARUDO
MDTWNNQKDGIAESDILQPYVLLERMDLE